VVVGLIVMMTAGPRLRRVVQHYDPAVLEQVAAQVRRRPEPVDLLTGGILYPVLETLLFLLGYWALLRDRDLRPRPRTFIVIMGAAGYLLHGASIHTINRALAFALLAWLFARWAQRGGLGQAFAVTALAHIVWNQSLLIIYFARKGVW
jgi:hypothetical protein